MTNEGLRDAAYNPGFTPGKKDVAPLLELLATVGDEHAKAVEQALLRGPGPDVFTAASALLPASSRPLRARLVALLPRVAGGDAGSLRDLLLGLVDDPDLKAASHAVQALGRFEGDAVVEQALIARLAAARPEQRRALVRALGKIGGAAAGKALDDLAPAGDAELVRLIAQARLILARRGGRGEASVIRGDQAPGRALTLHFHCRRGLEPLVVDELAAVGVAAKKIADGRVAAVWSKPLAGAFVPRCFDELALAFKATDPLDFLTSPETISLLRSLTAGALRYRLGFGTDAERWALAGAVTARRPELVNDPTQTTWELRRDEPTGTLELVPKRLEDPRFAYRVALVPASSHAPLAAALANLGGVKAGDVVWDPFCGAGSELIERATLGPFAALIGSDLDPSALAAARTNLAAAGLGDRAALLEGDCLSLTLPAAPTLILSNPPLGRRVKRGEAEGLSAALIVRAGALMAPGGRLVLVSPAPEATRAAGKAAGFIIDFDHSVDLGGFFARLQRFVRA